MIEQQKKQNLPSPRTNNRTYTKQHHHRLIEKRKQTQQGPNRACTCRFLSFFSRSFSAHAARWGATLEKPVAAARTLAHSNPQIPTPHAKLDFLSSHLKTPNPEARSPIIKMYFFWFRSNTPPARPPPSLFVGLGRLLLPILLDELLLHVARHGLVRLVLHGELALALCAGRCCHGLQVRLRIPTSRNKPIAIALDHYYSLSTHARTHLRDGAEVRGVAKHLGQGRVRLDGHAAAVFAHVVRLLV